MHRGSGIATPGTREGAISAGSTVYIPRNPGQPAQHGHGALGIAFVFSRPGFEQLMRESSVLEGETPTPLSAEEAAEIRSRHRWHTVNDQP